MKQEVVREMSTAELQEKLELEVARLEKLRMAHAVTPLENPMELKFARRGVARLKTELHNRSSEATKS